MWRTLHSLSLLTDFFPRPTTLVRSSALELVPLQTVEMAKGHGYLHNMMRGPWVPCYQQCLGTCDSHEYYKCLKPGSQNPGLDPLPHTSFFLILLKIFIVSTLTHITHYFFMAAVNS
jgi:hypothetical protein